MTDAVNYLFSKISNATPKGCWEWRGYRNKLGYGQVRLKGIHERYTHRVFYSLQNGPIPKNLCVCHKCDNPSCVNPDHLFLGTHLENAQDRDRKFRYVSGQKLKTHCNRGHEYNILNTYIKSNGERVCRICISIWRKK